MTNSQLFQIGDFGLARFVQDGYYEISNLSTFPVRWTPPESLQIASGQLNGFCNTASDVWSFGVLMYEVASNGKLPFKDIYVLVQKQFFSRKKVVTREGRRYGVQLCVPNLCKLVYSIE